MYKVQYKKVIQTNNKRKAKLLLWILNNNNLVHELIKEEVDAQKMPVQTCQNIYFPYPEDAQYSQEIYNQGINTSTIHDLSEKQQMQLKRRVKIKKRTNAINKLR